MLLSEIHTEGYRAPVAARAFAYIGLAGYETIRPNLPADYISFGEEMAGLELPVIDSIDYYHEGIALNSCFAYLEFFFYNSNRPALKMAKKKLEESWDEFWAKSMAPNTLKYSKKMGRKIAEAICQWSATDEYGHLSQLHNYDRDYIPPSGKGKWQPSINFPMPPMLPSWGKVRTFMVDADQFPARALPQFSENPDSIYFKQAMELYALGNPLSPENKWIAEYWHDDHPGLTITHPGHWISIALQTIETSQASSDLAIETMLKVGIALSDASVTSWKSKYIYNLERPEVFINRNISSTWRSHLPAPSHPSYPSGHSTCGAAVTTILDKLYGAEFYLTDNSHVDRSELKLASRSFSSFREMSLENSVSRMLLGVHYRMDCEEGRRIGRLVGEEISQFDLQSSKE
ncbi:hypothetical protein GCM10025777_01330 [Membranihabitans marinus]